jgi:hypothetical protein
MSPYIFGFVGYFFEEYEINLNPNDYCNLTDVEYSAVLYDDEESKTNAVLITEYLTYDIHAASKDNEFKEIWRALPEDEVDGLQRRYEVHSVSQILDNGTEVPYKESMKIYWDDSDFVASNAKAWHHSKKNGTRPDNYESVLIYIPHTYRAKLKFKIVYTLYDTMLKYNDCSELYLSMYYGDTIKKLNSFKANIYIPTELMPMDYQYYTFGTTAGKFDVTESSGALKGGVAQYSTITLNEIINNAKTYTTKTYSTKNYYSSNTSNEIIEANASELPKVKESKDFRVFSFNLDKSKLQFDNFNNFIEFTLIAKGPDKWKFSKYASPNKYTNENALEDIVDESNTFYNDNSSKKTLSVMIFIVLAIVSLVLFKNKKKIIEMIKGNKPFYEPICDYDYFRDIPSDLDPLFAARLVSMGDPSLDNSDNQEEYAAIIMSLVRKKYVELQKNNGAEDWVRTNTVIRVNEIITDYINDGSNRVGYRSASTGEYLEPLTTSERLYYELLLKHARTTLDRSFTLAAYQTMLDKDYVNTNLFVKRIDKEPDLEIGVGKGYFSQPKYDEVVKKGKSVGKAMSITGLIILLLQLPLYFSDLGLCYGAYIIFAITLLICGVYVKYNSEKLVLLTQFGEDEKAKWKGLYNFLNNETLMSERTVPDIVLWEKYLIYATAFGISDKVVKVMKIKAQTVPELERSPILCRRSFVHSHSFRSTSRALGHSIHGSHFGGAYSGGRFAGGGGGGH